MTESETRELLAALRAARAGDFSARMTGDSELAQEVNALMGELREVTGGLTVKLRAVSDRGELGGRAELPFAAGDWRTLRDAVNGVISTVTAELRGLQEVVIAVARGEVDREMSTDLPGEMRELNVTINRMIVELASFASDVSRVSEQAGAKLSAQVAENQAAARLGIWRAFTHNVQLAEELALIARHKSDLLANVSHELRTPLNSLLILAKILSENPEANLTAKQVQYAQSIYGSGGDLLSLVNDILDLSKAEAGKMRIEPRDVPISELTAFVTRTFEPIAEQKQVALVIRVEPGTPESLHTDPQRLLQILKNLLGNAFKFTAKGQVTLRIYTPEAGKLSFAVSDTGIGIQKENQSRVFEAFQQEDGTTSQKYGGTGLGLSISRELASLLGGGIELESTPGTGSTFTVTLPVRAQERPEEEKSARPSQARALLETERMPERHPSLHGRKVLVVDDEMQDLFALTSLLERQGVQVLFAEGGATSLEILAATTDVDAVLMDVVMPAMNGYEVMRAIRENPLHATLPIIAVTGRVDESSARAAGASAYLAKPVDPAVLLSVLAESIRQ